MKVLTSWNVCFVSVWSVYVLATCQLFWYHWQNSAKGLCLLCVWKSTRYASCNHWLFTNTTLTFTILWANSADHKLETVCMKCQNLFSGKNKKNILRCHLLEILPRVLCVNKNASLLQVDDEGGRVWWRCFVSYVTGASKLILAYSWARPAILIAGKGRWRMFLFLHFLHFHSFSSFFPVPLFHLYYLFSPFLWEKTQNDPQGLMCF